MSAALPRTDVSLMVSAHNESANKNQISRAELSAACFLSKLIELPGYKTLLLELFVPQQHQKLYGKFTNYGFRWRMLLVPGSGL
jgi:hypothetical protein